MRNTVDLKGIRSLQNSSDVRAHFRKVGILVARGAKVQAPHITFHYANSIAMRLQRRPLTVYVYSTDFKAHWVEWGAGPSPLRGGRPYTAHHTLQRAAEMAGLRVVQTRKGTP